VAATLVAHFWLAVLGVVPGSSASLFSLIFQCFCELCPFISLLFCLIRIMGFCHLQLRTFPSCIAEPHSSSDPLPTNGTPVWGSLLLPQQRTETFLQLLPIFSHSPFPLHCPPPPQKKKPKTSEDQRHRTPYSKGHMCWAPEAVPACVKLRESSRLALYIQ
jgi:hypothetical protein